MLIPMPITCLKIILFVEKKRSMVFNNKFAASGSLRSTGRFSSVEIISPLRFDKVIAV